MPLLPENCSDFDNLVSIVASKTIQANIDPQRCSYSGNSPIVAVVLVCNAIKLGIMLFVATRLKDNPLITVGDAVESFLNDNDKTTVGLCLITKKDVIRAVRSSKHWIIHDQDKYGHSAGGKLARRRTKLWAASAGGRRWSLTVGFITLALLITAVLLHYAITAIQASGYRFQDIGFGEIDPAAIISGWSVGVNGSASAKVLASILIANLPQTILSFLYLNLNGLLTSVRLLLSSSRCLCQSVVPGSLLSKKHLRLRVLFDPQL